MWVSDIGTRSHQLLTGSALTFARALKEMFFVRAALHEEGAVLHVKKATKDNLCSLLLSERHNCTSFLHWRCSQ